MSEIPAPPEIEKEAEDASSSEFPKPETEKNYDTQKFYNDFHSSPEYQKGLDERNRKLKPGTLVPDIYRIRGYEGFGAPSEEDLKRNIGRSLSDTGTFKKASEEYKGAFMDYVGRFYDEHDGLWPIYFSPGQFDQGVVGASDEYKKAAALYNEATGMVNAVKDADIDINRSKAHDKLATHLYRKGLVKNYAQGALLGRMWLVADGVDSLAAITKMDL